MRGGPVPGALARWSSTSTWVDDLVAFATDVAAFLVALRGIDAADGPAPGAHNFHRGGLLTTYADETLRAVDTLGALVPREAALAVWADAVATTWRRAPVWVHGDVAVANLLVRDGRLAAVIDFGSSGVGDAACDTVLAWTLLHGDSRAAYRAGLGLDADTWARGRGWALWKALITLVGTPTDAGARRTLDEVLADRG